MKKRIKAVLIMLSMILAFLTLSISAYAKDFSSAIQISLDSRVTGLLSHTATYDYYSFTTGSGNNIYVCSWESDSGSNVAEVFSVYNSRGAQMGSSVSVYTNETQYLKLDANETYYVEVRANKPLGSNAADHSVIQEYSFVISAIPDESNTKDAAETIELNSEQRGNINNCHKLDKDYFKIKTASENEYELYGKNVDFDGTIYFELLDKDGAKVKQIGCSRGYSKTEKVELNSDSDYYFYVYGTRTAGGYASDYRIIGDYILALKKSSSDQETTVSPDVIEGKNLEWNEVGGKYYWYENGVKQGTVNDLNGVSGDGTIRGREIFDPASNSWYWLDACYDGAKAVGKEVWIPYVYQDEDQWDVERKRSIAYESDPGMEEIVLQAMVSQTGKWVRYDENGAMIKGWVRIEGALEDKYPEQAGNIYYYDNRTGLMAKGTVTLDGQEYHFDETTGVMDKGTVTINGNTYMK